MPPIDEPDADDLADSAEYRGAVLVAFALVAASGALVALLGCWLWHHWA